MAGKSEEPEKTVATISSSQEEPENGQPKNEEPNNEEPRQAFAALPTLDKAPTDALNVIIGHLPNARDVANLARTCKRLNAWAGKSGWQLFVQSNFPDFCNTIPGQITPPGWLKLAQDLTNNSKAWDRKGFNTFEVRPKDGLMIAQEREIEDHDNTYSGFKLRLLHTRPRSTESPVGIDENLLEVQVDKHVRHVENEALRERLNYLIFDSIYRRNQNRYMPDLQTIPPRTFVDSHMRLIGGLGNREEILVMGAGVDVTLRIMRSGPAVDGEKPVPVRWCSYGSRNQLFSYSGDLRNNGFDDVTAVKLASCDLMTSNKYNVDVVVARDSGSLHLIRMTNDPYPFLLQKFSFDLICQEDGLRHPSHIGVVSLSPNGQLLASCSRNHLFIHRMRKEDIPWLKDNRRRRPPYNEAILGVQVTRTTDIMDVKFVSNKYVTVGLRHSEGALVVGYVVGESGLIRDTSLLANEPTDFNEDSDDEESEPRGVTAICPMFHSSKPSGGVCFLAASTSGGVHLVDRRVSGSGIACTYFDYSNQDKITCLATHGRERFLAGAYAEAPADALLKIFDLRSGNKPYSWMKALPCSDATPYPRPRIPFDKPRRKLNGWQPCGLGPWAAGIDGRTLKACCKRKGHFLLREPLGCCDFHDDAKSVYWTPNTNVFLPKRYDKNDKSRLNDIWSISVPEYLSPSVYLGCYDQVMALELGVSAPTYEQPFQWTSYGQQDPPGLRPPVIQNYGIDSFGNTYPESWAQRALHTEPPEERVAMGRYKISIPYKKPKGEPENVNNITIYETHAALGCHSDELIQKYATFLPVLLKRGGPFKPDDRHKKDREEGAKKDAKETRLDLQWMDDL